MQETRLKPGAIIEGTIHRVNERGQGVLPDFHRPVLVPNTIPGEKVRVRITHLGAHLGVGILESVLSPSGHRIPPFCPHAPVCGGCDFGYVDYGYQLELKSGLFIHAMKTAGVPFDSSSISPIIASPQPLHYRNKLIFNVKFTYPRVIAGLFQRHSHNTVDIDSCPLQKKLINQAGPQVKRAITDRKWPVYNESRKTGSLRAFSLRSGTDGHLLLTLVVRKQNLSGLEEQAAIWIEEIEGLAGVLLNVNPKDTNTVFSDETILVKGRSTITTRIGNLCFNVAPTGFSQVNTAQTGQMIGSISDYPEKGTRLIDAFCGAGVLGLLLARNVTELLGIDIDSQAIEAAKSNAEQNKIFNVRFIRGDVDEVLPGILNVSNRDTGVILVDPPRKGLSESMRRVLASSPFKQIIYVSCNPKSLARDLVDLCKGGYRIHGLQPLDMFPQTLHVEGVAFLSR